MVVIHGLSSDRLDSSQVTWILGVISIFFGILSMTFWILILVAIFSQRPTDARATDPDETDPGVDPFAPEEREIQGS